LAVGLILDGRKFCKEEVMATDERSQELDKSGELANSATGTSANDVGGDYAEAMNVVVQPGSKAEEVCRRYTGDTAEDHETRERALSEATGEGATTSDAETSGGGTTAAASIGSLPLGIPATPDHDLLFRGGKTIADLIYTNFYIGGRNLWIDSDRRNIDDALQEAMSDARLNAIIAQYFSGPISSTFRGSSFLGRTRPAVVSRADIHGVVRDLHARGRLGGFDLGSTVFNFILPRGTILTSDDIPTNAQLVTEDEIEGSTNSSYADANDTDVAAGSNTTATAVSVSAAESSDVSDEDNPFEEEEEASSADGLGGYHGSVLIGVDKVT
jgi:hypothetical protein